MIQEYEEEILILEGTPELLATDFVDTPPAQGKPQCITNILNDHWIYIDVIRIYVIGILWKLHA